jgi:HSP20 family molecular chaperone IbpA
MADYFEDDEFFRGINAFYKRLMERMAKDIEDFEKAVSSGELEGSWDVKPIEEPGVKGYVAKGRFQLGKSTPTPKPVLDEEREPFADVFDEKDHVEVYVELPGVQKEDIQLNTTERAVEVRAKNFFRKVDLPTRAVDFEKATANYKNGVLEVRIPKVHGTAEDEKKRTIRIE